MREMPIIIEPYDIVVGSCSIDDTVVRCALPIYIKNEELGECSLQMSHKCPDYEKLLSRGLRSIIDELDATIDRINQSNPQLQETLYKKHFSPRRTTTI